MIEFELPFWVYIIYVVLGLLSLVLAYIVFYWSVVFTMDITKLDEALVKVWPFGKWDVAYKKDGKEFTRDMPSRKEAIVDNYFKYFKSDIIEDAWIIKVGGFFDGIKYRPRPRKGTRKE